MEQDNPFLKALSTPAPASVADNGDQSASDNGDQSASDNPFLKAMESPSDQAAPDQPADNTDYGSKDWLTDVLPATAKLAPKQFVDTLNGIGSTILHPLDTLNGIGKIGSGLVSKAEGYAGMQQDKGKKDETEAMINAIGQHYKDVYGGLLSGDTSGLKKELMTKGPIEPLMDVATVLTGGEGALAKAPGMLGKVGEVAGKLGSAIDPVQNALRAAKMVAKPITWAGSKVIPAMQAVGTGVEPAYLKMAAAAGASDDPVVKTAFMDGLKKKSDPLDIVAAINGAIKTKKSLASAAFEKIKNAIGLNGNGSGMPNLDWTGINNAMNDAEKEIYTTDSTGARFAKDPQAAKHFEEVKKRIWGDPEDLTNYPSLQGAAPDSVFQKLPGFDTLKQNIANMKYGVDGSVKNISPKTNTLLSSVGSAVKKAITDQHPEYANLMDDWSEHKDELDNVVRAFGRGDKLSGMQQLNKLMIQSRKSDGQSMIQDLSQYDKRIPYMIAGHTMSDWLPNRLIRAIENPFMLIAAMHNPAALSGLALTSPRIAGKANYLAGKASKIPNQLNLNRGLALEQGSAATQGYAKGGSVINPEKEAERLIAEADKARKSHGKITQPLMNLPDEAITKALAIANESI